MAELEVELGRSHRDREEAARVLDAMRAERAGLMGKVLEASRIQGKEAGLDFDLAGFISDLRAEAIALRTPALEVATPPSRRLDGGSAPSGSLDPVRAEAPALETVAVHSDVARNGLSAPGAMPVPGVPARLLAARSLRSGPPVGEASARGRLRAGRLFGRAQRCLPRRLSSR